MRIYFLNNDNLQILNDHFKNLYITTIDRFEFKLDKYKEQETNNDLKILINELIYTLDILRNPLFENFFNKWEIEILGKVRFASVSDHTDQCIIRAIFDILFKYSIDFEYKIPYLCCNNTRFKTLQFEILRDLRWKIRN
jgi:hypothetical protein